MPTAPPFETTNSLLGDDVPTPTRPPVVIRIRSDCDAVLKMIASEVPAPDVDCSVSVEEAVVPPLMSGTVSDVQVGVAVVPIVTLPVDAETVVFVPAVRLVTPVLAIVIEPEPLVTLMPVLAVNVPSE